ncbi:double-strand break repair helicase AddA [Acidimangrovimonas sediminis]|uniref:double-strand break repair helicase AddA n=1 Tax=Acidimangrovimonas sediminis TaxID=2056283 RepID=UPI000C80BD31|nr:double-strand break repair helicase AddA [Acidimangrovimonas sediminis]
MSRNEASESQVRAADPGASTWLSANAGSGKTRVLTDRVARLLLQGAQPQRILCLTYTKAAASEMQNRLFQRLGDWAMLEEGALRKALSELGIEGAIDNDTLARARRLFARAIETPGGLKIQTIHAFCASLLRRFPLEAGVTPAFAEMDDRRAALLREEVVDALAEQQTEVVDGVAQFLTDEDFSALCASVAGRRAGFAPPLTRDQVWQAFGLSPDDDDATLIAEVFLGGEEDWLPEVIATLAAGTKTDVKDAERLSLLSLDAPGIADLVALEDTFLFKTGEKAFTAKFDKFPTKSTRAALGPLLNRLEDLMRRVEAARPRRLALKAARRTAALHRFAGVFLPEYEARKAALGWLDFDDLILRTQALLTDPSVAQWVLFRLDGGIDHILVDEAQDTSPAQWQVIERLTQEFTAGQGARGAGRTIFVVGDKKQSIYSFQGADLRAFDHMQDKFATGLRAAGEGMQTLTLDYSFRSSDAVLRLVDMTFEAGRGAGLGGASKHLAFHAGMPGRVDLWPVIEPVSDPEDGDWTDPVDLVSDRHHTAILAQQIADEIARMLATGTQVPTDGKGGARRMTAGDVLILVQRRGTLFHEVIRACKAAGLPIAGADRLRLGAELAVRDLRALLSFVATPEDSLSLAAALRSPLFGWSEAQLYGLAQGRKSRFLWEAFRKRSDEFDEDAAILDDLRRQSDYLRPYELLERILTRHDGRARLLARLGTEAEDGIDEMLNQALAYEQLDVPSLTGFLGWLDADDVEVKRQPDSAGGRIRVMTVHGAKGLEAPVVILPDTADRNAPRPAALVDLGDGVAGWTTPAAESPPLIAAALAEARARQEEENQRLLYVALTRARCWLIVCAAGKAGKDTAWYQMVRAGMESAGGVLESVSVPAEFGPVQRLQHGHWPDDLGAPSASAPETAAPDPGLPAWATCHAPEAEEPARPVSPSSLGGAKALPGEGLPEAEAKKRGALLHRLLEHMPLWPEESRIAMARDLIASSADPVSDADTATLLEEAEAILSAGDLSALFAPGTMAEVGVTAELGGQRLFGIIDRLVIDADRILAVDYKSNATIPETAEGVPDGILRQMGAYARALAQVYPDRRIETAILWTRAARLMPLPDALIMAALRDAGFP